MSTAQLPQVRWLNCLLDKGMFSDEVAVTYPGQGTNRISVFVPRDSVKGEPGTYGKVRVNLVEQSGELMAILPSAGNDIVFVSETDVADR
jgi:hypothetical protein